MSQPVAVASASLARSSPRCQVWSSRPRLPSGSSRLWSGPATKPSSEIDMWQVVSGIGALPRWFAICKWRQHPSQGDRKLLPSCGRIAAMPFTLRNLREDLPDVGSNFDGPPDLEFRLATDALALEQSGLSFQSIPPDYRFPYGHTHK